MLSLSCTRDRKRQLFGRSFQLSLEALLEVPQEKPIPSSIPISTVTRRLLEEAAHILPFTQYEIRKEDGETISLLENLRGRPEESFGNAAAANPDRPRKEELFFSNGVVYEPPANLEDFPEELEMLHTSPFSYSLSSSFHSFSNSGNIYHQATPSVSGALAPLADSLSPQLISRIAPLKLEHVRLGFESFRSKFWGTWLGVIPRVEGRFYLEIEREKIWLSVEETTKKREQALPLEDTGIYHILDEIFDSEGLFSRFGDAVKVETSSRN